MCSNLNYENTPILFWPPSTPLLYSKTGVYRGIHYFSYFCSKTYVIGTRRGGSNEYHNLCFEQKYEKYQNFYLNFFLLLFVKFSCNLNRCVFVMVSTCGWRLTINVNGRVRRGLVCGFRLFTYRIRPNYRTYPYKRTVKQFCCLQITASLFSRYFFIKAYVVGTHLNCIDLSMQFKWVPTTYAFIKKIRKETA